MNILEKILEFGGMKRDIIFLVISGIALILSLFNFGEQPFDPAWIAIVLCGVPIILEAVYGLVTAFDIKADVLVSMALIAAVVIGEDFAAGEVAFIMQLGALLEDVTVARARAGIEKLVHLTPRTARVITASGEKTVMAEEVKVSDRLRVLPGETVPVDGVIISGETSVDESVMTGESLPVDKSAGDKVKSGTANRFGACEMSATAVGEDSSIQRRIRLVQSADADKAKIVGLADRWATWIVVIALVAASLTGLITKEIIRAVTILVVFCPCALVLATPTAIMAAIGNGAKRGILVRDGGALERLAGVSRITFDKTGTLTYGKPRVTAVQAFGGRDKEQIFSLLASAELLSEHPLGKAVVEEYTKKKGKKPPKPASFKILPGRGVTAEIDGLKVDAGNETLMADCGAEGYRNSGAEVWLKNGGTVIYVAVGGRFSGFAVLADTIRSDACDTIAEIKKQGVVPILLTGDRRETAEFIARSAGIENVKYQCLPEDKMAEIEKMQKEGNPVCMVGDGINDAPALKKADVGIAMGGIGSDIAVDAADIALVRDDISVLPHLLALSGRMMRTIKLNMAFSMALNFAAIVLAMTGILNPVVGALVHNAGSVLVIINSAFLLSWKYRKRP